MQMNMNEQGDWRRKAHDLGVQALGHAATYVLAMVLLVLWVLTGPLFKWGDSVAEGWRRKKSPTIKESYE